MSVAREIRTAVERAGGRLELSVRELRDAFGISRLTAAGRQTLTKELRRAKLRIEPPLGERRLDERVTIVDARRRASKVTSPPPPDRPSSADARSDSSSDDPWKSAKATRAFGPHSAASGASTTPLSAEPNTPGKSWARRRGVLAGAVIGLLVILLAAVFGSQGGGDSKDPPPTSIPPSVAEDATQSRAEALSYLKLANSAIAADDPEEARALLAEIDQSNRVDPDLGRRIARTRVLARLTERYIRAEDLADSGSYLAARQAMRAIAPFRKARAKARGYATLAARTLVSQARGVYERRPARALELIDRASELAPTLASIETVRALAISRQQALSAPPQPPTPAPVASPSPAASNCDPNYTGACIPLVSFDLDCGDVAATDFNSVGSDPHGFDREGDGLACES